MNLFNVLVQLTDAIEDAELNNLLYYFQEGYYGEYVALTNGCSRLTETRFDEKYDYVLGANEFKWFLTLLRLNEIHYNALPESVIEYVKEVAHFNPERDL